MNKTEIKKALYKQQPEASLILVRGGFIHYECSLEDGTVLYFNVPVEDIGDAGFYPVMEAKHLQRWLPDE
jgi:hypothetical protein